MSYKNKKRKPDLYKEDLDLSKYTIRMRNPGEWIVCKIILWFIPINLCKFTFHNTQAAIQHCRRLEYDRLHQTQLAKDYEDDIDARAAKLEKLFSENNIKSPTIIG